MYEWLDREISEINLKKFHVIENQQIGGVIDQLVDIYLSLPPSYIAFLSKFGAVKLYRKLSYYQIGVLNPPKEKILHSGEKLLDIGHYNDARAYFRYSLLLPGKESPVFEWTEEGFERIADSFEEWLIKRCTDARDSYTDEEWQDILNLKPFTNEEVAIVQARQHFQWRAVGFDQDENLLIAIRNESKLILPYLSIGIIAKDNTLKGVIWLDVSGIHPGQQEVVKHPGYKELIAPDNTEVYSLPDPLPEDRESYWEFRR
ncbi:hypothetical protein [Nostoc sp. NMS9]|uniref:hypothetical protein n=1 Tax=Nostoc sp. NMS9 TaxID=2815393 RepID=UPI0025F88B40|nr:hypothetical protein [Nostoc sp. NMS9]MBN3941110.1 SMI1/KNR4 family protein [Nostoc sp. NMS9]